jgi:FkbM family methyltransferase
LHRRGLFSGPTGSLRQSATFHLARFTLVEGEAVSRQIESYGIYEDSLTEAFLHLIKPGQVVVDIGMHLGYYTTLFATLVGAEGQVHAFEPTPSTRAIAQQNVQPFAQVTVHPEAVWSSVQTLSFRDYGPEWMAFNSFTRAKLDHVPEPKIFSVQTITLDRFRETLSRPVALLKIDAESAERQILDGGKELLRTDQPLISLEVGDADQPGASRSLVEYLQDAGYLPWEFRRANFHPHQARSSYGYDNLIFAPGSRNLVAV